MSIFLRRQTNYSGGISAGGGDTGWDKVPQPTLLCKKVVGTNVVEATLPKGTTILDIVVYPHPDAPATAGTVDITDVTNAVVLGAAISLTAASFARLATIAQTTSDIRVRITPTGLSASEGAYVGLNVILPPIRD